MQNGPLGPVNPRIIIRSFQMISLSFGILPILLYIFTYPFLKPRAMPFALWEIVFLLPALGAMPFRAFVGTGELTSSQRIQTSALIGYALAMLSVLLSLFCFASPSVVYVCYGVSYLVGFNVYRQAMQQFNQL